MQYLELAPPAALSAVVQCFWFLRGSRTETAPQTIVPDGRMEIVLHLGEPFAEVDDLGCARPQAGALVAGQLVAPLRVRPMGYTDVVGIRLRPAATPSLFRIPAAELGAGVTPLELIAPGLRASLTDAVAGDRDPALRSRRIATSLSRSMIREPAPAISSAVESLGTVSPPTVRDLAKGLGWSTRTLERRMREETGVSPTTLRRILRFRRAFRLLDRRPAGEWSRIASTAGYFDQAHMIRDFRCFAGTSPSAFFQADPSLSRALTGAEEPAA